MASKLYNYLNAEREAREKQQRSANFLERGVETVGDVLGNVVTGAAKGIEGVADFGMGIVGAVGGIFDKDFRDDVQKAIEYDATHEWIGKHLDKWTDDSFTNDSEIGGIVESVANGVGQMLPSVAVTLITGGLGAPAAVAQAASLGTMAAGAAGSSTEEAYKDGAEYYRGLGYGTVSGAIEAGTEKLFGGTTSKLFGKGALDLGKEVAEQGAKRVIKGAVEEGVEELSSHAVSPIAKTIYKGRDALSEYGTADYWKEAGKTFLAGAGTGALYGGTFGKVLSKVQGTSEDISAALDANERISSELIRAQNDVELTDAIELKASESRAENLKNVEIQLKRADENTRERYIKNYNLSDTFNSDGSIKAEALNDTTTPELDRRYYSVSARGKESQILADLAEMSNERESIRAFTGDLSEKAQKNFTKMKKALTSLNNHRGENVSYVIVEPNSSFNGATRRGDTIYVAADALERDASISYLDEASHDGNYAGTLIHENDHINEGTGERAELFSYLADDRELFAAAASRVLSNSGYGISESDIESITQKQNSGIELTEDEKRKYNTFVSEVGATMNEYYLGNEDFVHRLVMEDAPLAERVIDKLAGLRASLARLPDAEARAEYKRLRHAENLYLKATRAAGNMRLYNKILASINEDEKEDEKNANEHISENMSVSDGEIEYSLKAVENYQKRIDTWDRITEGFSFVLGETPSYLSNILIEGKRIGKKQVRIDATKIKKIMKDHPEMTIEVIKALPSLLNDPILVLDSRTVKDRLILLGEVYANDKPVMMALEVNPSTRSGNSNYVDVIKIASAYTRSNTQNMLNNSNIRYINENESRVNEWLKVNRLHLPLPNSHSDSAINSISDSHEKVNSDTKFSYKAPAESKVYQRTAEWEKLKVYEKRDAEKIINTIISDVLPLSDSESAALTLESRKQAEKLLWAKLNSALTDKEMKAAAEQVADYVISESIVKSWVSDPYEISNIENAESALAALRPLLHRLRLSSFASEIKHRFDKSANGIMLMWGTRKTGIGVDEIVSELNREVTGYGFPIDATASEADIFFAIHDAYTAARADVRAAYDNYRDRALDKSEREKLRADISKNILETYQSYGRDSTLANATRLFRAELWKADRRVEYMKQYSKLISKVDAFRNLTMGRFENANTYHPDLFAGSVEELKKIVRGGLISVKGTRSAVGKLAQWYTDDNPLVGEANFDPAIRDKLAQVSDRGLSDYAGRRIDPQELLEPYKHRIDLSGIRDRLKEMYAEENRGILATWNAKPGEESITLGEIAAELEKQGVRITGDDFELFTQIHQIYADAVGPLTVEDLRDLTDIVAYFTNFIKNFNKVWNGKRYVDADPIARKYVGQIKNNSKINLGFLGKWLSGRYGQSFLRPETLARYMDRYSDGFYTEQLESFRQGLITANNHEYEMMRAVVEFNDKHKKYFSELTKRRIEYRGNKIPADIALSLYMTAKREQARAGLASSGFKYTDGEDVVDVKGYMEHKTPGGVQLGAERMQKLLYDEFTAEDKEFISIAESIFNGQCKALKRDTDMQTKGYTNTVDGYYYPIKRAFIAKSVDSDFEDLMGRASNKSFNQDTVRGAKGVLCIMPLTEVFSRHVRGVAQYASLATVVRNYDTLFNLDVGDNANDPTSVAREGEKIWKEGSDYFKKLLADMQGVGKKQSAFLSVIRGHYATYQLGGNPKTWITQLSSFFASTSELDFENVVAGFGVDGGDVDEYCVLAKLRDANNDAVLAQANANKPGLLAKRSKLEESSQKVSDVLMAPIGAVDRFVITKLFGACQVQVEKHGGAKLGTQENKLAAGKLLERVIISTQQNSLATERSSAMRSDNEIFKSLTMFSADAMNVFGQVIDSVGEVTLLKAKLKGVLGEKERVQLEKALKAANKKAARSIAALATSAAFMAMISLLFNYLYHRIDEEDDAGDITLDVLADFVGNMIGGFPVFRDVYSYLTDGYEVKNYLYSVLNDTLDAASSCIGIAQSAMSGGFDSRKATQAVRKVIYSAGQLLGIPTRNLYNVTYSILGFIPSVKYGWDNMFYEQAYSADLKRAIEAGDEDAIATIAGIMTGERVGSIESDKVREELNGLTLKGYNVLPRAVADSIKISDEETLELSNTQKKRFKEVYSIANDTVADLIALKQYSTADEEVRAKAIKTVYDVYYELACDNVTGRDSENKNALFAEAIDVEKLALIVATARSIKADTDSRGKTISGTRKRKIERYVASLRLSAAQKYMIMGYLGYSNKNGEQLVRSYVNRLENLTPAEKTLLIEYSGYKK